MDIRNLTKEEYDAAIAAADLVCKILNKDKVAKVILPSQHQETIQRVCNCHEIKIVTVPCGLNHYPPHPVGGTPYGTAAPWPCNLKHF